MGNVYGTRTLVWVTPFTGSTIKYGFYTNADSSTQTALGHNVILAAKPTGLVLGANAPKPAKATRQRASGSDSSFCDVGAFTSAKAAGWKIRPGRIRIGSSSVKSKLVYVLHEGNKIAWKMPQTLYSRITAGDRTALGILDGVAADKDYCYGVRYPSLPRVGQQTFPTVGAGSRLTTFCDPSKLNNLPTGWVTVKASEEAP
jgi:hypothetical protein